MGWTWYLGLDMQYFIISTILIILLFKNYKQGVIATLFLLIVTFIIQIIILFHYNISSTMLNYNK